MFDCSMARKSKIENQNSKILSILYDDNHLLVLDKPAGLIVQGAAEDQPSLLRLARGYLKQKYRKPGNVYLGVVSRLDSAATGVVVFARTSSGMPVMSR